VNGRVVSSQDHGPWFELCTDAHDEALAWSETSTISRRSYPMLISERETEQFFEFTRRNDDEFPTTTGLSRVHKCSDLDRSMFDLRHPGEVVGIFHLRPVILATVHRLIEYLLFIDPENLCGW
jgi:hypothetical protein